MKLRHPLFFALILNVLLTGCSTSSMKVWPFDGDKPGGRPSGPANATEYTCEGGKRFFVRFVDNNATAWVIYPDREVRMDKSSSGNRYSNGIAILEINGSEASLKDGEKIAYTGCKAGAKPN